MAIISHAHVKENQLDEENKSATVVGIVADIVAEPGEG